MSESLPSLFRHESRPDWGLATIAWERDGKRAYLFETGMLRVLAEPFYRFMIPVETTKERDLATLERLVTQVDAKDAQIVSSRASLPPGSHFGISEQLAVFRESHKDGFDEVWRSSVRGVDAPRRLKRHRDPAIAQMQQELNVGRLEEALRTAEFGQVWLGIAGVLDQTDLVAAGPVQQLKKSAKRASTGNVNALGQVLFGAGDFSDRFDAYVTSLERMLGRVPSWELTTAILALTDPKQHVCVKRQNFQQQAEWMVPELRATDRPNALAYGGFMSLAKTVCQQLEHAGLTPQDYFDVYDFVRVTTAPKAVAKMTAQRRSGPVSNAPRSGPARAA
ncbi:MAG TPA: hypothetical protein VHM70_26550 [Polyangiaceae bacterium]|jgi:hypothetical protein|nr:hypothetical protein [Polyangiaceae bacterium]